MTGEENGFVVGQSNDNTPHREDDSQPDDPVARAVDQALREERQRLAQLLHEGPAQCLASALYVVDLVAKTADRSPDRLPEQLERLRGLLKESLDEVRATLADLRKSS